MTEQAIKAMDKVVQIVYTPDQSGLADAFLEMLDAFSEFIGEMEKKGYTVSMNESLLELQNAFESKDYIRLTDCILYDLKPDFENLDV